MTPVPEKVNVPPVPIVRAVVFVAVEIPEKGMAGTSAATRVRKVGAPAEPLGAAKNVLAACEGVAMIWPLPFVPTTDRVAPTVAPLSWLAFTTPVPAAASTPEELIVTPLVVPLAKKEATPAVEVPTVLTWNRGNVPVLAVVS
jgi:hypothetical protein